MSLFPSKYKPETNLDLIDQGTLTAIAGNSFSKGDIVCINSDTGISPLVFKSKRDNVVTDYVQSISTQYSNGGASSFCATAVLTDGKFVVTHTDGSQYPYYGLYTSAGELIGSLTAVTGGLNINGLSITSLTDGGFVIAYTDPSNYPYFCRYNSNGVLQQDQILIEAVVSSGGMISVSRLTGGGFVTVYSSGSAYGRFARYNAAGVLQGAITQVEAITGSQYISITGLTDGSFVIAYRDNSLYPKFGRYNSSGVLQGTLTTIESVQSTYNQVFSLTDGGFVICWRTNTGGYPRFARYNASGVLQGSLTSVENLACVGHLFGTSLPAGGFVIAYTSSGASTVGRPRYIRYNASGVAQSTCTEIESTLGACNYTRVSSFSDGKYIICYNHQGTIKYAIVNTSLSINLNKSVFPLLPTSTDTLQGTLNTVEIKANVVCNSIAALVGGGYVTTDNANASNISINRFNSAGVKLGSTTTSNAGSIGYAVALADGGYIIAYAINNSYIYITKYNYLGIIQGSTEAIVVNSAYAISIAPLTDGGFVIAYGDTNPYYPKFIRFNNMGGVVGVPTLIESSSITITNGISIAGLLDGGFVVAYSNSTFLKFARYNSLGVLQGAITTVEPSTTHSFPCICGLSNGGFAIGYKLSTGNQLKLMMYNSAGVRTAAIFSESATNYPALTGTLDGGFVAAYVLGGYLNYVRYDSTGTLRGSAVVDVATTAQYPAVCTLLDGSVVFCYYVSTGTLVKTARFSTTTQMILGVANSSAIAGNPMEVQISGLWGKPKAVEINTEFEAKPVSFDQKAIGGNAGIVASKSVYLRGL